MKTAKQLVLAIFVFTAASASAHARTFEEAALAAGLNYQMPHFYLAERGIDSLAGVDKFTFSVFDQPQFGGRRWQCNTK